MKKLTLDLDALRVETFDAGPGRPGRGTVAANQVVTGVFPLCSGADSTACEPTDERLYTCAPSCERMCHATGDGYTCAC